MSTERAPDVDGELLEDGVRVSPQRDDDGERGAEDGVVEAARRDGGDPQGAAGPDGHEAGSGARDRCLPQAARRRGEQVSRRATLTDDCRPRHVRRRSTLPDNPSRIRTPSLPGDNRHVQQNDSHFHAC